MARPPSETLTPRELQIMQILWRRGASNVGSVQQALAAASPEQQLAYTTVQTLLNILEKKGKVRRELVGAAYVYATRVTEENALGQAVRDLVDRMFGGSSEDLVMSLIKSREIDPSRIALLTQLVEDADLDTEKGRDV